MAIQYKADFDQLDWQSPIEGVRHKVIDQNPVRMRLVEYSQAMPPHWCQKGHYGYLIEGQMEMEYPDATIVYNPGDGIFIRKGEPEKHKARVLGSLVTLILVERA